LEVLTEIPGRRLWERVADTGAAAFFGEEGLIVVAAVDMLLLSKGLMRGN